MVPTSTLASTETTPDLAATIESLEERLNILQERIATPTRDAASSPSMAEERTPLPTPTLRVVTLSTPTSIPAPTSTPAPVIRVDGEAAVEIARRYLGGGEVVDVEREKKYGADVWEVQFRFGTEIYVDTATGLIVYAEIVEADRVTPTPTVPPPPPPTATRIPSPTPTSPPPDPRDDDEQEENANEQDEDDDSSDDDHDDEDEEEDDDDQEDD